MVKFARKRFPVTDDYHGGALTVREQGRRFITPLFIVLIAIGTTDLLFALDSIPAVFGVTDEAFIVFAANAFALLGLRALYFLVTGLLDRLVYLSTGLSLILAFIGVKLVLHWAHEDLSTDVPEISTSASLIVIGVVLVVTTVASLLKTRGHPELKAKPGSLRAHAPKDEERALERFADRLAGGRELGRQALEQDLPVRVVLDRLADLGGAGLEVAGLGDRQARPEQQLVARGRQLGRLAVELAGVVRAAGGQQLVARAREVVGALEQRAGGAARRAARRGPRRAGRRCAARARRRAARSTIAADWRPRTSPPSPSAASRAVSRRSESRPVALANASDIACGTVSRAIMLAWQLWRSPTTWPACAMQSVPVWVPIVPRASITATWRTAASGSAASSSPRTCWALTCSESRSSAFGP